jgi:hypothetical protein
MEEYPRAMMFPQQGEQVCPKKWREVPRNIGISLRRTNLLQSIEGILGGTTTSFQWGKCVLRGMDGIIERRRGKHVS